MSKQTATITEADVQAALRRFKLAGGKIQHMPDAPTPPRTIVHGRWESLSAIAEGRGVPAPAVLTGGAE